MKKLAFILLLALGACSLGKKTETAIYNIRQIEITEQTCKLGKNLQISTPTSAPGLDTRRIAVYENAAKLNFYTNARWSATAPEMLQAALIEGFEKAKSFESVATDLDATNADVILLTDIRSFQIEGKDVNIRFVSKIIDAETRDVIATIPVEKKVTPSEHKIAAIVESFGAATNDAVKEVVDKTVSSYPVCSPR